MAQDNEVPEALKPGIYSGLVVREDLSTTIIAVAVGADGTKVTLPLTEDQARELVLDMADMVRQARICAKDKEYARQLFEERRFSSR